MEERQTILEMAHRFRKNCRICGAPIGFEESFQSDDITTVHMECFFDFQAKEGKPNECAV